MKCFFTRSLLALMCTVFLCVNASSVLASTANSDISLDRIHQNAQHNLYAYTDTGHEVLLHDTSKWAINPAQNHIVLRWVQSDILFIKPFSACCTPYRYVLHNYTTQETVEANLIYPLPDQALYIINIDRYARLVQLNDNTIWAIDSKVKDWEFNQWQMGQRVLIGVNNNWRSGPLPHVLINVDLYKEPYCQADFYGYGVYY